MGVWELGCGRENLSASHSCSSSSPAGEDRGGHMGNKVLESLSFFTTSEAVEEVVAIKPVEAGDG